MRPNSMMKRSAAGVSMIELVMCLGIFGILAAGASVQLNLVFKSAALLDYDIDLVNIASDLRAQTNCTRTTADLKAAFGGLLPPVGTPVTLRKANGAAVLGALGATASPLADSRSHGNNWWVKATWATSGIDVSLAKTTPSGTFALRPFDRVPLDFTVAKQQLFRDAPLCADLNTRSYSIDVVKSDSTEASTLMGIPNPELSYLEPLSKIPIGMSQVCHRICSSNTAGRSFISGWMVGLSDTRLVVDPNTGEYSDERRPPGQGVVHCRCLR